MGVTEQEINEPIGDYWLCAGECGQWRKGMAAAHNGSGYVCRECEEKNQMRPIDLLFFIRDACAQLPDGYDLNVNFTRGDMDAELCDPDGERIDVQCAVDRPGDAGYLQYAINTARRHAGLPEFYHERLIDHRVINEPIG